MSDFGGAWLGIKPSDPHTYGQLFIAIFHNSESNIARPSVLLQCGTDPSDGIPL
jgi:hypothetical protein